MIVKKATASMGVAGVVLVVMMVYFSAKTCSTRSAIEAVPVPSYLLPNQDNVRRMAYVLKPRYRFSVPVDLDQTQFTDPKDNLSSHQSGARDETNNEYYVPDESTPSPHTDRRVTNDGTGTQLPETHNPDSGKREGVNLIDIRNIKVEVFPSWSQSNPRDKVLTLRVYLYSAFIAVHRPDNTSSGASIHIVAFQEGRKLMPLKCCLKLQGQDSYEGGQFQLDFSKSYINQRSLPTNSRGDTVGVVYSCLFQLDAKQIKEADITLTATSCPENTKDFLKVQAPEIKPKGSIGLCGKVMFGHELDPYKLVEWFEIQRLLGVDKIVLFDLDHTEAIDRILKHYQFSGLLTRLAYKLPGRPWGRDIRRGRQRDNYGDEQVLTTWDCRLRLAGYDYILGIDMDEVVMPRRFNSLKAFLKKQFGSKRKLAALFLKVQFFFDQWGPLDQVSPLHMLQYLNSSKPLSQRRKYVYMPSRTHQPLTHRIIPYRGYFRKEVLPRDATLFHYRKCPKRSCDDMARITDSTMTRYRDILTPEVLSVLKNVGLH